MCKLHLVTDCPSLESQFSYIWVHYPKMLSNQDHVHKRAEQKNGNKSPCSTSTMISLECLQTTHTAQKNTYKCWATNTAALTRLISSSGFDTSSSKLFKALIRPYSQKVCQPHKNLLLGQETLGITKWSHHKQRHPQVHAPPWNYFVLRRKPFIPHIT